MRIRRCVIVVRTVALAVCVSACPAEYDAWRVPSTERAVPVFGIGLSAGSTDNPYAVQRVDVSTCSGYSANMAWTQGHAVWVAIATDSVPKGPPRERVKYGAPMPGMKDSLAAAPLGPGCYEFHVDARPGSASVRFWVDRDGTVRDPTRHEIDSMHSDGLVGLTLTRSADAQAEATCRVGYGNARSRADSQRVNQWIGYDTTRHSPLTCADLQRLVPDEIAQPRKSRTP